MSTLNFPSSPTVGQTHTVGNKTYIWNGYAWIISTTNNFSSGQIAITSSTQATSTVTGALTVSGGAGISGDLYVGGNLNVDGTISGTLSGSAAQVDTQKQTSTTTHFITFVDSNNETAQNEYVYTTSSFSITPDTGNVNISGDVWVDKRVNAESVRIADTVFDTTTISLNTNATAVIDTYSLLEYRSAKYFVQVSEGTGPTAEFQAQEITVIANNTSTAYISEYGLVTTNGPSGLGTFDAIVDGDDVKLRFTPDFSTSKVVKVLRIAMEV